MEAKVLLENGEVLDLDKGFASFFPVLEKILSLTSGAVLELGTGIYSTPFLHWLCFARKRELFSYESNRAYFELFQSYQAEFHKMFLVRDFKSIIPDRHFDVIFIDHSPSEDRLERLQSLVKDANFVIVHDVAPGEFEGVARYRLDYPASPGTSVFSNFIDMSAILI